MIDNIKINVDCRFFKGDIPCKPHKQYGVHCFDENDNICKYYQNTTENILIIKLGAIGDVIRTTPILHKLKYKFPTAKIWWLTLTPEIVPSLVDNVLMWNHSSLVILQQTTFSKIYNFDKDKDACALVNAIQSNEKFGFTLKNGISSPVNELSKQKYFTGIFDDLNKKNKKSYLTELFEIAGEQFNGESYILDNINTIDYNWNIPKNKIIVGLNTGCSGRWSSRLWPNEHWIKLAKKLKKNGYIPLFLGGEQEHEKNKMLSKKSNALYFGHFQLKQFIDLINQCSIIITSVTMALHISIGLKKKIILFNNIFNKNEFELYNLGTILEPDFECSCFFSPVCNNNCMQYITVDKVFSTLKQILT